MWMYLLSSPVLLCSHHCLISVGNMPPQIVAQMSVGLLSPARLPHCSVMGSWDEPGRDNSRGRMGETPFCITSLDKCHLTK